jgi:hypothetical protein
LFIEKLLERSRGSPVERAEANAFKDDPLKISAEGFEGFVVFVKYLTLSALVHPNTTESHFQYGSLKGSGEVVGGCGVVVELREEGIEDLCCDTYVKSVINLIAFELG